MNTLPIAKSSTDYYALQKKFLNIPFKDYVEYIYPRIGMEKQMRYVLNVLTSVSGCDEEYIVDFSEIAPDTDLTVGQLLRIACIMLDKSAKDKYRNIEIETIRTIGMTIVEMLVVLPFSKLAGQDFRYTDSNRFEKVYRIIGDIDENYDCLFEEGVDF